MKIPIIKRKAFRETTISSLLLVTYFICTSQFWAYWWYIYLPIGLIVIPFFILTSVNCIIFWIKNYNKYRMSYAPFGIILIAIAIVYLLPSRNRSKQYYINKGSLCNYNTASCG